MRHAKEVRVRLHGDREAAERYRKRALTILGSVINQDIKLGGLQQAWRTVALPGGVAIQVHANSWMPTVDIFVPPLEESETEEVGLLIDFVTVTDPFLSGTTARQTPHVFNAFLTAFRDPDPPLGVPVPTGLVVNTLLAGGKSLYGPQYAYDSALYITRREELVLGPTTPFVPYERHTLTVPLPAGEAVYVNELYSIVFGWGTSHAQGEQPRHIVANTQNVFILVERVFPSVTSIGGDGRPFAMTSTLLLDIYDFDGTRRSRIQLAPSMELTTSGTGPFVISDKMAAYDNGVYLLLKPTPFLAGYDVLKWDTDDGFQWSAAALPPDVTDPVTIHAGALGPYLVDTSNGYPRISQLNPTNGESVAQITVSEASFPPVINGFVTSAIAVTASFVYVSLGIEFTGGPTIGATTHRILRYTPDLALQDSIDTQELAAAVGVDLSLGYAIPYEDASLLVAI